MLAASAGASALNTGSSVVGRCSPTSPSRSTAPNQISAQALAQIQSWPPHQSTICPLALCQGRCLTPRENSTRCFFRPSSTAYFTSFFLWSRIDFMVSMATSSLARTLLPQQGTANLTRALEDPPRTGHHFPGFRSTARLRSFGSGGLHRTSRIRFVGCWK